MIAYTLVLIATLAATYVAKMVVFDVGWRDHKANPTSSTARTLAVCVVIAALMIALPLFVGGGLASRGHPGWASVVAIGSFVLSAGGFVVLAGAFKP